MASNKVHSFCVAGSDLIHVVHQAPKHVGRNCGGIGSMTSTSSNPNQWATQHIFPLIYVYNDYILSHQSIIFMINLKTGFWNWAPFWILEDRPKLTRLQF